MPSRIEELLERQGAELESLTEAEVRRFLAAYEDGRRHLRERLEQLQRMGLGRTWTAQHTRVALAQVEAGVVGLQGRLGQVLTDGELRSHDLALKHLVGVIRRQELRFRDTGGRIEARALSRLTEERGLLLWKHSLNRYGAQLVERIQGQLVLGQVAQQGIDQVIDRIVASDESVFGAMRHRAELIARMETSRAYNAGHQGSLEAAAEEFGEEDDDPLLKRIDEFHDKRNHPFSRAAHGRLAPVNGEWRVPVEQVRRWGAALGRGVSGVLWPVDGSDYVGGTLPAHFNDRARQTPWRRSWGSSGVVEAPDAEPAKPKRKKAVKTRPSGKPDPNAKPRGVKREMPRPNHPSFQRIQREVETCAALARAGYDVEVLPDKSSEKVKRPDMRLEGRLFDVYSPTGNVQTARTKLRRKANELQARRAVVNLADAKFTAEELWEVLRRSPPSGVEEVIAFVDGEFVRVL